MKNIFIDDLERVLGYVITQIDFTEVTDKPINYDWGNDKELNRRLIWKGESISANNALKEDESKKVYKYPLIWLVLPNEGVKGESDWFYHRNTQIIIAKNTQSDFFNETRWNVSFELLSGIANILFSNIEGKFFQIEKNSKAESKFRFIKYPNYSVNGKNGIIDIWDALSVNVDLILKTNCITKQILNYNDKCRKNGL